MQQQFAVSEVCNEQQYATTGCSITMQWTTVGSSSMTHQQFTCNTPYNKHRLNNTVLTPAGMQQESYAAAVSVQTHSLAAWSIVCEHRHALMHVKGTTMATFTFRRPCCCKAAWYLLCLCCVPGAAYISLVLSLQFAYAAGSSSMEANVGGIVHLE